MGTANGTIYRWSLLDQEPKILHQLHSTMVSCLAFSSCGCYIASADYNGTVYVFDNDSKRDLLSKTIQNNTVCSLAFSKNSKSLLCQCIQPKPLCLDLKSGDFITHNESHVFLPTYQAYSFDFKYRAILKKVISN